MVSFALGNAKTARGVVFTAHSSLRGDASGDSTIIVLRRGRDGARNAIHGGCSYFGSFSCFDPDCLFRDCCQLQPSHHGNGIGDEFGDLRVGLLRRQLFRATIRRSAAIGPLDTTLPSLATPSYAPGTAADADRELATQIELPEQQKSAAAMQCGASSSLS
jgi:hypothetical protein